jgi:hypothetical protein
MLYPPRRIAIKRKHSIPEPEVPIDSKVSDALNGLLVLLQERSPITIKIFVPRSNPPDSCINPRNMVPCIYLLEEAIVTETRMAEIEDIVFLTHIYVRPILLIAATANARP